MRRLIAGFTAAVAAQKGQKAAMTRSNLIAVCLSPIAFSGFILFFPFARSVAAERPFKVSAELSADAATVVKGNTAFALDLYRQLRQQKGNLFFSPYSISTALAMTYVGARGETATEIAQVLHFTLSNQRLHPAFSALIAGLNTGRQKGFQLNVANRLWGQKGYSFLEEFLKINQEYYSASVEEVDFGVPEEARDLINNWVTQRTQDKITALIPQGILSSDTQLVLTNAIYFAAAWFTPFKPELTSTQPFTTLGGQQVPVPMMHQPGQIFGYAELDSLKAIELPYVDGRLSMVILLPHKVDGLPQLENSLSAEKLEKWLLSLSGDVPIEVWLPKFQLNSKFELSDTLAAMGMPLAFKANANFSGMSEQNKIFISHVIHKTFVDVNEAGTEAAAATGVVVTRGSGNSSFKADHPFLFLIRETESGSILFLGRVVNPLD